MTWPMVKLGDVAQRIDYGLTASAKEDNEGPRFLRITDMQDDAVDWSTVPSCECSAKEFNENELSVGDIVFARTGATTGKSFLIRSLPRPSVFASYLIRVRPKDEVDSKYLAYFFKSPQYWSQIKAMANGAAQPGVNSSKLKELEIPLPPLAEQQCIAAILDKADAIRRKRQQAIQLADDFLRAVFLDMFGDPVTNPRGWEVAELADVVKEGTIITYGIVQAGPEVSDGIPYVRTGDFKSGLLSSEGFARTHPDIAAKFSRSRVETGDLIYCIRASIGSVDIVPEFLNGANLTQGTARISPGENILGEYLVEFLRCQGFRDWVDRHSKGATFKEITLGTLRQAPVLVPPLEIQRKFKNIRQSVLLAVKGKMEKMELPLFEALSQKAFNGNL